MIVIVKPIRAIETVPYHWVIGEESTTMPREVQA
jgi:hypothetical protein